MSIFRKEEEQSSLNPFLLGAFVGAAAGLAVHFLLKTRAYQSVRKEVISKYHDLSDAAEGFVEGNIAQKKTKRKTRH